jgi:hypothetical protein
MEHINVEDLPEPVARAVQAMVQALREQLTKEQKKEASELPVWPGTVIGSLTEKKSMTTSRKLAMLLMQDIPPFAVI